jgi:hypothetical protein
MLQIKTKTITFLFLALLFGLQFCKSKNEQLIAGIVISEEEHLSDSVRNARDLNELVYRISQESDVEEGYIGIEGRKSTQPNYSHMLALWADTNQLVKLTNHSCAIVKLFSFEALLEKGYPNLKTILQSHIADIQVYSLHSGCTVEQVPINFAFFNMLSPSLNKIETTSFKNELLKKYKNIYPYYLLDH